MKAGGDHGNREPAKFGLALLGFLRHPLHPSYMHPSSEKSKTVRLNQGTGSQWSPCVTCKTSYLLVRLSADS